MSYIVARKYDEEGSVAYPFSTNLIGLISDLSLRYLDDGIEIITVSNMEGYPEYSPYKLTESIEEFNHKIKEMVKGGKIMDKKISVKWLNNLYINAQLYADEDLDIKFNEKTSAYNERQLRAISQAFVQLFEEKYQGTDVLKKLQDDGAYSTRYGKLEDEFNEIIDEHDETFEKLTDWEDLKDELLEEDDVREEYNKLKEEGDD